MKETTENKKFNKLNHNWKGCGDFPGSDFNKIRHHAKERNIPFNVTIEQLWDLFVKQNRKCVLTGLSLQFRSHTMIWDGTASLDRIDNSKGYVINNVQWIHKDINKMKTNFVQEKFIEYCKLIYETKVVN